MSSRPLPTPRTKRTCRSGSTVYKHDGVRVFEDGGFDGEWFACGPRSRRPTPLYSSEASYGGLSVVGQSAGKTLFVAEFSGEGGGEQTTVGWFDARTSRARSGDLAGDVSNDVRELVVAPDGGIGVVEAEATDYDGGIRVGYLAPSPRKGELRDELVLSAAGGPYVKRSLAFADGGRSLSWRLADGRTRSVPLAGEAVTCTSGTTLVESGGARVFEVFPRRKTERGFQADVLAACDRGATTPRELGVTDVYDQQQWIARSVRRSGSRVAFLAGYTRHRDDRRRRRHGALRRAEGPSSRSSESRSAPPGRRCSPARAHEDGQIAQPMIARLTGGGLGRARDPGRRRLVDGSLAVGDDALVTWQTKDGAHAVRAARGRDHDRLRRGHDRARQGRPARVRGAPRRERRRAAVRLRAGRDRSGEAADGPPHGELAGVRAGARARPDRALSPRPRAVGTSTRC